MAEDPTGAIRPDGAAGSTRRGDAPEPLLRRYFLDGRGGPGLGFYVDARIPAAAFRDEGRRLSARRTDPHAIRDMAAIANHRGWTRVVVRGDPEFRREAWMALRIQGLEVRGYRPTDRDIEALRRQTERRVQAASEQDTERPGRERRSAPLANPAAAARLRVVEAVVGDRVRSPEARNRIVAAARDRLATWLERGAKIEPLRATPPAPIVERPRGQERNRSR
ncbi:LPD7 domain-containing protein [Phenylobacterium sp.]|uniref:LPD7 domain-containing protein n=1 Tax=Phenylobacterium sp. TaxID=1871053 RepID=UPI0035B0F32F